LPFYTKISLTNCEKTWYNKTLNKIVEISPIPNYMLARSEMDCKTKSNIFTTPPGVSTTNTAERNGVIKAHEGERRTARQNHTKELCTHQRDFGDAQSDRGAEKVLSVVPRRGAARGFCRHRVHHGLHRKSG